MNTQAAQLKAEKANRPVHMPAPKNAERWSVKLHTGNGVFHDVIDEDRQTVAKIHAIAPSFGDIEAQGIINARLIASAPALKESLQEVMEILKDLVSAGKINLNDLSDEQREKAGNAEDILNILDCRYLRS